MQYHVTVMCKAIGLTIIILDTYLAHPSICLSIDPGLTNYHFVSFIDTGFGVYNNIFYYYKLHSFLITNGAIQWCIKELLSIGNCVAN